MSKINRLQKTLRGLRLFRCTITRTPAVLLHIHRARLADDPVAFVEELHGVKLYPYQREMIERIAEIDKSAVPLHIRWETTPEQAKQIAYFHLHKAPPFYHQDQYVTRYRKWWQFWKPKEWQEFVPPPPPEHVNCRCTITPTLFFKDDPYAEI